MGCNLIGPKIDYLNKNTFKEYKIKKSCIQKNVSNKRKSVSGMNYIHFSCFTYS